MPRSLSSPSAQMRNWEHGAVKNTSSTLATAKHLLVELTFSFFSLQRQGQCLTSPPRLEISKEYHGVALKLCQQKLSTIVV